MYKLLLTLTLVLFACAPVRQADVHERLRAERLIDRGVVFLREIKLEEAESAFALSYELVESAAAIDGLGCVAMLRGDYGAAERYFHEAYALNSEYHTALANLGLLYDVLGFEPEARQAYSRVVAADPENFRVRNNFAALQNDCSSQENSAVVALDHLRKAKILVDHPLIQSNIEQISEE